MLSAQDVQGSKRAVGPSTGKLTGKLLIFDHRTTLASDRERGRGAFDDFTHTGGGQRKGRETPRLC